MTYIFLVCTLVMLLTMFGPGDLPNPGIKPRSPTLQADSLLSEPSGKPKNTGVGSLSLLQGILLTQESNWGLQRCRRIHYWLSYQRSPLWVYVLCLVAQLCLTLYDPMEYSPPGSSVYGDSLGKNAGVGCHALARHAGFPRGEHRGSRHRFL